MSKRKLMTVCAGYVTRKDICGLDFIKGGEFVLVNGELQAHVCHNGKSDRHFVYAHVVNGQVVYVGESSHTVLNRTRLYIVHEGTTNVRVRTAHIADLLAGKVVEIYYYKPHPVLIDGVLNVNPYIGIEQALISKLKPILNKKDVGEK